MEAVNVTSGASGGRGSVVSRVCGGMGRGKVTDRIFVGKAEAEAVGFV